MALSRMSRVAPSVRAVAALSPVLVAGWMAAAPAAAQPAPPRRIAEVMARPEFAHASWGMEFYDLQTGRTVFAHNRQQLFVPGSTTKVVTMGTALEVLGPDHRFRTRMYRTGPVVGGIVQGDLVLVASGDPNLSGRARPDGRYAFIDQDHSYGGPPLPDDPLLVMKSLALAPALASRGQFALIPAHWHQPLAQRMVLMPNAPAAARAFYEHLATPAAQAVMKRHGFEVPTR